MNYIFHMSDNSTIIVTSDQENGLLSPEQLQNLVRRLNTPIDIDTLAKTMAIHNHHQGKDVDMEMVWATFPEHTQEIWRGMAVGLMHRFFIRQY